MINSGIKAVVPAIAAAAFLLGACGSDDGSALAAEEPVTAAEDSQQPAPDPTTTTVTATEPPATTEPPTSEPTGAPAEEPVFTAQDATDVVKAIGQAYNTYDADLFMSVTAEDFLFVDERGTADRSTQASYFPALREGSHQGERTSDLVVISEDPFVVAEDVVVTANFYPPEGRVGTSTYTLIVENGELKVLEHRWTGDLL